MDYTLKDLTDDAKLFDFLKLLRFDDKFLKPSFVHLLNNSISDAVNKFAEDYTRKNVKYKDTGDLALDESLYTINIQDYKRDLLNKIYDNEVVINKGNIILLAIDGGYITIDIKDLCIKILTSSNSKDESLNSEINLSIMPNETCERLEYVSKSRSHIHKGKTNTVIYRKKYKQVYSSEGELVDFYEVPDILDREIVNKQLRAIPFDYLIGKEKYNLENRERGY